MQIKGVCGDFCVRIFMFSVEVEFFPGFSKTLVKFRVLMEGLGIGILLVSLKERNWGALCDF